MSKEQYKHVMRTRFERLSFQRCANCDEMTLYRDVQTERVACIECSYVEYEAHVHVTHAHTSISECNYDAKTIAARIIARARAH